MRSIQRPLNDVLYRKTRSVLPVAMNLNHTFAHAYSKSTRFVASPLSPNIAHSIQATTSNEIMDSNLYNQLQGRSRMYSETNYPGQHLEDHDPDSLYRRPKFTPQELAIVRRPGDTAVKAFRFDRKGDYDICLFDPTHLKNVPPRDLVALEDYEIKRNGPVILPRRDCIIMSLSHVKAVIFADSLVLLDIDKPIVQMFAEVLSDFIHDSLPDPNDDVVVDSTGAASFEMRAMEGVLRIVSDTYTRRLQCYAPVVASVLREMSTGQVDTRSIQRLLPLKDSLISFERAADELLSVVVVLLKSDQDMKDLFLTAKLKQRRSEYMKTVHRATPDSATDPKEHKEHREHREHKVRVPSVEAQRDCELLLESFEREAVQLRAEARNLRKKIQAAEDFTRIIRDARRNKLIGIQARTAVASMGIATGALVTGVFGMNLTSGLEHAPWAFPAGAMVTIVVPCMVYWYTNKYVLDPPKEKHVNMANIALNNDQVATKFSALARTALRGPDLDLQQLRESVSKLGDMQDTLLQLVDSKTTITRQELAVLIEEATGQVCPAEVVELAFKLYASDGVTLSIDQLRMLLCDSPSTRWTRTRYY